MMLTKKEITKFWFCPGSVDLYGDEEIRIVTEHSRKIVDEMNQSGLVPYEIVLKPTLLTNENIRKTFNAANEDENCAGVIAWMHMFSPAKSWMLGLKDLRKPLLHLHTQFNEEIPYDTLDMGFININQSAHGDREFAYMLARMKKEHKIVVGHWKSERVQKKIGDWMITAIGLVESNHLRVARFADNMLNVADTEGDKVEAQLKFGWEVDTYTIVDAADVVNAVSQSDINILTDEYYDKYGILLEGRDPQEFRRHVEEQARIEIGFERFLEEKNIRLWLLILDNLED